MTSKEIPFFFYKNFTLEENLKRVCLNYEILDGSIRVSSYDGHRLAFSLDDSKNSIILKGKIVHFPLSNTEVLKRIGTISDCKLDKSRYIMKRVGIKNRNDTIECYIIY